MSSPSSGRTCRVVASSGVLSTVVALAICGGVAAAKTEPSPPPPPGFPTLVPKGPKAARHIALQNEAGRLINLAGTRTFATRPSCRPVFPRPTSKRTRDVPSREILDAVAAFRRPAVALDVFPQRLVGGLGETYVDYVRSVTSASGKSFFIGVARTVRFAYRLSDRCLALQRRKLVDLLAGKGAPLRSIALQEFGRIDDSARRTPSVPATPQDTLWFFSKGPGGVGLSGGSGGTPVDFFLAHGMFMSSGFRGSSTLSGLLPDGVASVTLHYPKIVSNGRWYKPTVYPSAYTRTVGVQENVVSVRVPRGAGAAFPPRMVWRAADGTVVRVVRQPRR